MDTRHHGCGFELSHLRILKGAARGNQRRLFFAPWLGSVCFDGEGVSLAVFFGLGVVRWR
jgi:hypothetical protein